MIIALIIYTILMFVTFNVCAYVDGVHTTKNEGRFFNGRSGPPVWICLFFAPVFLFTVIIYVIVTFKVWNILYTRYCSFLRKKFSLEYKNEIVKDIIE